MRFIAFATPSVNVLLFNELRKISIENRQSNRHLIIRWVLDKNKILSDQFTRTLVVLLSLKKGNKMSWGGHFHLNDSV